MSSIRLKLLSIGSRSVLFGAHCFFLHPWFVARAWWKLYGFPWDPRLWVAFFVHDLGYLGKPNMDGPEGEMHPVVGAFIMHLFFGGAWGDLVYCHSRYLAKKSGKPFSKLCVADKLAFALTPRWMYLPMVRASGEINEYLKQAANSDNDSRFKAKDYRGREEDWHEALRKYMLAWVVEHADGTPDTWTSANRHARDASGVWQ